MSGNFGKLQVYSKKTPSFLRAGNTTQSQTETESFFFNH